MLLAALWLALEVASIFIYDQVHKADDPQPMVSLGRLDWEEPRVSAAMRIMERHVEQPKSVRAVARAVGLSERMLEGDGSERVREADSTASASMRMALSLLPGRGPG